MIIRRRRQKRAYYNEVPFFIETDEISGGHRVVKHEFPYQKEPFTEDLGLKGKEYSIAGFLAGQGYKEDKVKLIAQLDKVNEVGLLKHPYIGPLRVRCSSYRVTEVNKESGFIRLQMLFVDAGEEYEQAAVVQALKIGSPDQSLTKKIEDTLEKCDKFITEQTQKLTKQENALENYLDSLNAFTETLEDRLVPIVRMREGLVNLRVELEKQKEVLSQLAGEPGMLIKSACAVFKSPENLVAAEAFISILLDKSPGALSPVFEAVKLSVASEAIIHAPLDGEQAEEAKGKFLAAVEYFMNSNPPVDLFDSIQMLKIEMVEYFQRIGLKRNSAPFTTRSRTNSIVLAYELYGDLTHEETICKLNKIANPAQIPAGQTLQVPIYE
jgi:prophage DNA circulation protein